MDTSVVIVPMLKMALLILLSIVIIGAILKSRWFKGKSGEAIVNLAASFALDKNVYHLINDVTIPTKSGSTQIDHIIASEYGIFVIETKNMKGWIFGDSTRKKWTQVIYKKKTQFQNPLHQNYGHVKSLQNLLGINEHQMFSIVVFAGDSTFKTKMPENVVGPKGYIRFIKSKTEKVLSNIDVKRIVDQIESQRLERSYKTNREHINHLKAKR